MSPLRNFFDILIALGIFGVLAAGLWFGLPRRLFEPVAVCCVFASTGIVFAYLALNGVRCWTMKLRLSKFSPDTHEFSRFREPGAFWLSVALFTVFSLFALAAGVWALFTKF